VFPERRVMRLSLALRAARSTAPSKALHHVRSAETYDFAVGNLRHHAASGRTLLDISYPVSDQPGVVRGIVSAALDMSWISHATVDSHLYPGTTFSLLNSSGTVLLRYPDGADWVGKSIFLHALDPRSD